MIIKSDQEITIMRQAATTTESDEKKLVAMRRAGRIVATILEILSNHVKPGVKTKKLDSIAARELKRLGAISSFKGYHGFPAHICTSVNDEVVHGIPGGRVLQEGDLISVDCGAIVDGWHGDAAISVPVGQISPQTTQLSAVTRAALWAGLAAAQVDARLSDIGHAVQNSIEAAGPFGIVEEYVGHGIGTQMHLEPAVPNYGRPGRGPRLVEGMALAIEPMVTAGSARVHTLDDDWTVVTSDGLPAGRADRAARRVRRGRRQADPVAGVPTQGRRRPDARPRRGHRRAASVVVAGAPGRRSALTSSRRRSGYASRSRSACVTAARLTPSSRASAARLG